MEKKQNKYNYIFAILMVLTPVIVTAIIALVQGITKGMLPFPGLKWNDEAAYVELIRTCVKTGQPVGYYGFDGNHALLGTGSAWSPAILWPYAIFAFIFPAGQSFVYFVNLFYITLANVIFVLLVKPEWKNSLRGIVFQATSAVLILYLNVNMSEIFRFSVAIVLAGMFYRLFFLETKAWLKYAVMPLFILLSIQIYVFFAFCVPIYVFGILKDKKWWIRLISGIVSMGIVAGGSYVFLHMISSNYNIAKTEGLLAALKAGQILSAVKAFIFMLKEGASGVFHLWQYVYAYPLYPFHVLICIALVGVGIALAVLAVATYRKQQKDSSQKLGENKDFVIGLCVSYSVAIFFLMYMSLYTIVPDTFMRGTYIVVIFSLYLLFMVERKWFVRGIILFQAIGLFLMAPNWKDFMTDRVEIAAQNEEWASLENQFAEVITFRDSKDPWDNTVLMYTMEPKAICAVPAGMGVNFVLTDGVFTSDAEYLLFSKRDASERRADWVEKDYEYYKTTYGEEINSLYGNIYEDEIYVIYKKNH